MKKWVPIALAAAALLSLPASLNAQAVAAGTYRTHIQVGGGYMYLNNDYTDRKNGGATIWGDYDFLRYKIINIGAEAELHFGGIISPDDIGENSYLVGPRFSYRRRKLGVYAKIMVGRGTISNQRTNASSSYNIIPAFGGGVEYRVTPHINIRAVDFELQQWPNFEPNTLSPIAISIGALYTFR